MAHLSSCSVRLGCMGHDQSSLFQTGSHGPCSGESPRATGEHPLNKNCTMTLEFGLNTVNNPKGLQTTENGVLILQHISVLGLSKITLT